MTLVYGPASAAMETALAIGVMGPLEIRRDGQVVDHPDLRRQRVRELLSYLIAHRRVRREQAAEDLWPHLHDSARNLRVTLSYLQRVLQPDRHAGHRYLVRSDSVWLELSDERLTVDVWTLDAALERAEHTDRHGAAATAIAAYQGALALWRGQPYADVPYAPWARGRCERLRDRYTTAALRAAELCLAAGDLIGAQSAAQAGIDADPWSEPAYRLLARSRLAAGDTIGARRAMTARDLALGDESIVALAPATTC